MLTQVELKELLDYSPITGKFTWKISTGRVSKGMEAGRINPGNGYIDIGIKGRMHLAHRLAWLYITGDWPKACIDHVDSNRKNNAFSNLREATYTENNYNAVKREDNTSGVKGIYWHAKRKKWTARTMVNGKRHHIGYFDELIEATQAIQEFRAIQHGAFCNHGK